MKFTTEEMAIEAEKQLHEIHKDHKDGFNLPEASLWVMNKNGNMVCQTTDSDIYNLLDKKSTVKFVKGYDFFAILCAGWAAPISNTDEDTPPSLAVGRRRVRLMVGANYDGVASVLRFADTPNDIICDDHEARGALHDAIVKLRNKKEKLEFKELTKDFENNQEG